MRCRRKRLPLSFPPKSAGLVNRTSRWAGKFPDILISDHVLSLPPSVRKFQTVDPRIGYRAAADIGRLEWHTRFMVPFES